MEGKNATTIWIEKIFDTSEPYLYIIVLPVLVLFALGFRTQAIIFGVGAVAFLAFLGMR